MKLLKIITIATLLIVIPFKVASAKTVTIAVIDSGIDYRLPNLCRFGHKSFVKRLPNPLVDEHGHGTHVAGLINSNAGEGNYCLVAIKYYDPAAPGSVNLQNMVKAIQYAVNIKAKFINISGGGPEFNESEFLVIKKALDKKIKVVVAAGNGDEAGVGVDLDKKCNYYPACYDKRIISVGNLKITKDFRKLDADWKMLAIKAGMADKLGSYETDRAPSSNFGKVVTRWEVGTDVESTLPDGKTGRMTGTSQATAVATGKLVRELLKK